MTIGRKWLAVVSLLAMTLLVAALLSSRERIHEPAPAGDRIGTMVTQGDSNDSAEADPESRAQAVDEAQASQKPPTEPSTQPDSEEGAVAERKAPPQKEAEPEPVWGTPPDRLATVARQRLERALDGDLEAARQLQEFRWVCMENAPYSPWDAERRIQSKARLWAAQIAYNPDFDPHNDEDSPWNLYESLEENRAAIARWDRACQEIAALFSPAFRNKLARDAESGKVIARYLFATWPPGQVAPRAAALSLEERLQWEEAARRHTALNLAAGEAAGLLAFADSYDQALFTGMNDLLDKAFELAAVECGYRPVPDSWVSKFLEGDPESQWLSEEAAQRVRLLADSLASLCRNRGTRR